MFLAGEEVVVQVDARGDHVGHATLDQALDGLWIFELLDDGDAVASLDELGQIRLQSVVRESGERYLRGRAVGAFGQDDIECFRGFFRIAAKGFVEIPHAKQKHGFRMLGFDFIVLTHHWRLFSRGRFPHLHLLCH